MFLCFFFLLMSDVRLASHLQLNKSKMNIRQWGKIPPACQSDSITQNCQHKGQVMSLSVSNLSQEACENLDIYGSYSSLSKYAGMLAFAKTFHCKKNIITENGATNIIQSQTKNLLLRRADEQTRQRSKQTAMQPKAIRGLHSCG